MIYYRAFRVTDLSTLILLEQLRWRSAKVPFYRRKTGIIIIILSIIAMGAIIGGAIEGTKSALEASHNLALDTTITTVTESTTTVMIATTATTTTMFATETISPSPTCIWEGTAPFCNGKCHTGFTQVQTDGCGDGACCFIGLKVYCCQE